MDCLRMLSAIVFQSVWTPPYSDRPSKFVYPGKGASGWIQRYRSDVISVLGRYEDGKPNFIRIRQGNGAFFIIPHLWHSLTILSAQIECAIFSKGNVGAARRPEKCGVERLLFDKPGDEPSKRKGILSTLMEYKSFHAWFYAMLSLLILYVLMEMRRRQRMIPPHERPKNDSLDFCQNHGKTLL